ncbi:MAG: site-specific integrase [Bifidobacterium psychraerophilum]|uniref:tyrosine-type recombinase/integrase n=1 Tax=Bifidobacterium psychraerophilum TaxID=218140 RepID=UPI0039E7390C
MKEINENGGSSYDSKTTVSKYAKHWLEQKMHDVDPKTYRNYRVLVNYDLGSIACKQISKVIRSNVQKVLNDAVNKQRKPATLNLKRQLSTCLNQMFTAVYGDRLIPFNPVAAVKTLTRKDAPLTRSAFSIPEITAILSAASDANQTDPAIAARMWFRMLTGMRQGEILGAQWSQYDEQNHIYRVDWKMEQVMRGHGCGEQSNGEWPRGKVNGSACTNPVWLTPDGYAMEQLQNSWCLTRPKSKTGRIVPVVPELVEVLRRHRALTKDWNNPNNLIFCHLKGGIIDPKEDSKDFRDLLAKAKITGVKHTGHETRHSVVTLLASQGVDFQLIQEIVGHSSDAMLEHYRHADNTERLKAMETLDSSLNLAQIEWKK